MLTLFFFFFSSQLQLLHPNPMPFPCNSDGGEWNLRIAADWNPVGWDSTHPRLEPKNQLLSSPRCNQHLASLFCFQYRSTSTWRRCHNKLKKKDYRLIPKWNDEKRKKESKKQGRVEGSCLAENTHTGINFHRQSGYFSKHCYKKIIIVMATVSAESLKRWLTRISKV